MNEIWIEKYRPRKFFDVKGQDKIIERLSAFVKQKNIPHMLFAGPSGCGKTTLSLIIAKELYGDNWKSNFLDLNASDDRGIDVVRTTIKDFARTKSIGTDLQKIVYLDECDSLTSEAQQALRRTMENFSQTARFILSCNVSSKIIEPIQSRCAIFRFKLLDKKNVSIIVENVCKNEKVKIDDEAINAIYDVCEGDVRKAINILQSCAAVDKEISSNAIYDVASAVKPHEIKEILEIAMRDFVKAREKLLSVMLKYGLSGLDVIKQIQKEIINLKISDDDKIRLIDKCGEIEFRLVEGSDEYLQLESLLANFLLRRESK